MGRSRLGDDNVICPGTLILKQSGHEFTDKVHLFATIENLSGLYGTCVKVYRPSEEMLFIVMSDECECGSHLVCDTEGNVGYLYLAVNSRLFQVIE